MFIKFSAKRIPVVGQQFVSKITYFVHKDLRGKPKPNQRIDVGTKLTVVGHAVEGEWLYVLATCEGPLAKHTQREPVYVAGCDVAAWEPEVVVDLPDRILQLESALRRFDSHVVGYGASLSLAALDSAQQNARALLGDVEAPQRATSPVTGKMAVIGRMLRELREALTAAEKEATLDSLDVLRAKLLTYEESGDHDHGDGTLGVGMPCPGGDCLVADARKLIRRRS